MCFDLQTNNTTFYRTNPQKARNHYATCSCRSVVTETFITFTIESTTGCAPKWKLYGPPRLLFKKVCSCCKVIIWLNQNEWQFWFGESCVWRWEWMLALYGRKLDQFWVVYSRYCFPWSSGVHSSWFPSTGHSIKEGHQKNLPSLHRDLFFAINM